MTAHWPGLHGRHGSAVAVACLARRAVHRHAAACAPSASAPRQHDRAGRDDQDHNDRCAATVVSQRPREHGPPASSATTHAQRRRAARSVLPRGSCLSALERLRSSSDPMADVTPIQGELQVQAMATLWRLGSGTVEQVRSDLPRRYRGAYTTIQTVLNRLADRGLLERQREGRGIVYRPKVTEADYLSGAIRQTLAGASADARQAALVALFGDLADAERSEVQRLAEQARSARGRRRK
jgi:predicted transcriptional regulator